MSTIAEKQSGRHPVNVGHLVMGIAFVAIVGVWALVQGDVVDGGDVRWLLPVPWVLGGLGGLLAVALTGRRRHPPRTDPADPADANDPEPETDPDPTTDPTTDPETDPTEEIR